MKEPSLKQILLEEINKTSGWLTKGQLALVAENEGFLGETAGRQLRVLEEDGLIKVSYYKSKRNIDLARYARLGEQEPIPSKPKISIINVNGMPMAIMQ